MENDFPPPDVCVLLEGSLGISVSVSIQIEEGTATFEDFTNRDSALTFSADSGNLQCFELNISEDEFLENPEQFGIELFSPDDMVDVVNGSLAVTVEDSSEVVLGFANVTGSITEGGIFMACAQVFSGELAEQVVLTLNVQPSEGQGEHDLQ
jgi:hypothetical protein